MHAVPCPRRSLSRLASSLLLLLSACATDAPGRLSEVRWVDLSHDFAADTVYWPTAPGFELTVDAKGMTEKGYWYESNTFRGSEHGGTHLDAPVHFAEERWTTDRIPLDRLIGPAVVVDVRLQCEQDRDYEVRVDDLEAFERRHGRLAPGTIVLLHTGFGRFWPDRARYMGTDARGQAATLQLHFPGLGPAAARWLVQRSVHAVGIDTPSIDHGQSRLFHSHRELFKANVPAFENVANLELVPATGAVIVALPMKIRGGSGGPLRIVAAVPD
ncbi:MAG: cyclase family protein [Planctomycetota bacterium]